MRPETTVLIVRLSHLGDVVQTMPLFHALRDAWPRARIGWAVQREFAPLLAAVRGLDAVLTLDRRGGARAWIDLARALARFGGRDGIDLAIDAQGNTKSAAVLLLSRARRRVGPAPSDRRERLGWLAATESAPPAVGIHAADRVRALVRHLVPERTDAPRRDLAPSPEELAVARATSDDLLGQGTGAIVVHVGDPDDPRTWPATRVAAFARAAAARGRRTLLLSGAVSERIGAALERELADATGVAHWVGQSDLRGLAAFLTVQAERGGCFVGPDSGPIHLAAAAGLPSVVIAGPQDPARTGPWPLVDHAQVSARADLPCRPCFARRCRLPEGPRCTAEADESDVLAAVDALAAGPARHSASNRLTSR